MSKQGDFREWRRADDLTSASAHPELVSGDFAIPPRPGVPIRALNRSVANDRRRAMGGMFAIAAIAVLLLGLTFKAGAAEGSDYGLQKLARPCLNWHLAASEAMSRQVQVARDVDLLFVSSSIDRLRRAQRHCDLGEFAHACEDYHAVASSLPGHAMSNEMFPCTRIAVSAQR